MSATATPDAPPAKRRSKPAPDAPEPGRIKSEFQCPFPAMVRWFPSESARDGDAKCAVVTGINGQGDLALLVFDKYGRADATRRRVFHRRDKCAAPQDIHRNGCWDYALQPGEQ